MKRLTFLNLVGAGLILGGLVTVMAQDEETEQAVINSLKRLESTAKRFVPLHS